MATITILADDIDGTQDDVEHIQFSIDGVNYGIDLGPVNAQKLRDALSVFISHAERVSGRSTARRSSSSVPAASSAASSRSATSMSKEQLQAIREWARKNGHEVSDRGRVSRAVKDAFEAAHQLIA